MRIEVRPFHSADFVLTHRSRDGEADDSPDWNFLVGICIKSGDQAIQFILRWSPVAFVPLPDETKSRERDAR